MNRKNNILKVTLTLCFINVLNVNALLTNIEDLDDSCAYVRRHGVLCGTGFFIRVPLDAKNLETSATYFVTAKHVVDGHGLFGRADSALDLRVNQTGFKQAMNMTYPLLLSGSQPWLEHDDPGVDLAVFPIMAFWSDVTDSKSYLKMLQNRVPTGIVWQGEKHPDSNFATTSDVLKPFDIGSEVVMCGLAPNFEAKINPHGSRQNRPLYRWGRISAFIDDNAHVAERARD
jgi:hypothetical protein